MRIKVLLLIVLLLSSFNFAAEKDLKKITLQLKWKPQFQFAGFYTAYEKGFYREAGLDVELRKSFKGMNMFDEVLQRRADIGIETSDILQLRVQGLPFVVLAVIFQHSPEVLVIPKGSNINTPHDLIGKKVLMRPGIGDLTLKALFLEEGIPINDINIIGDQWSYNELVEGKVDAMASYSTDAKTILHKKGLEVDFIEPIKYGIDFYGDCMFTTEQFLEDNKEYIPAFLEATFKGWNYAMENKDEICDMLISQYGAVKSHDELMAEATVMEDLILPKFIPIGHMNPGRWKHIADTYVKLGVIKPNYNLEGFLYQPEPEIDIKRFYWIAIAFFSFFLISGAIIFALSVFNRKLRTEVAKRTLEFQNAREKAEKSERVKTEFLAQMSHEIRSPLNTILSFVSLIREEFQNNKNEDIDSSFHSIDLAGKRIIRTVDLLLNMSEIQTGSYSVIMRELNLMDDILRPIHKEYLRTAEDKNLKLHLNGKRDEIIINADEYSINQIFANLVDNAIKYTSSGSIDISCYLNDSQKVTVEIKDTGVGISPEFLETIFQPFSQEEQGYTRNYDGNGLGLALVKKYCEINGAEISVESQKGQGSTFRVLFQNSQVKPQ